MTTHFTRSQALEFARLCQNGDKATILAYAENQAENNSGKGWRDAFAKLAAWLAGGELATVLFKLDGNSKLPFACWSTLPIVTCPGAGDCVKYCYSLKAWRYPAAFIRQVQNTIAMRFDRRLIVEEFKALPSGITLRLYVDGDFDSPQTVLFWFNLLHQRPDINAYGYSKSWGELLQMAGRWPSNYVLNISSGGTGTEEQKAELLKYARGEYIVVQTTRKHSKGFARFDSADYHRDVRESAMASGIGKVFSCPGSCGDCTGAGHACGLVSLSLPIAIGVH